MAVDVKVAAVKQCDVSYVQQAQMTHNDVPIKDPQGYIIDMFMDAPIASINR